MSNIVPHPAHRVAAPGPSPLSDTLKAALEPPMIPVSTEHGYDERPGPWKLPAVVTPAMAAEAREHLRWLSKVQLVNAEDHSIRGWLIALGNAVASSSSLSSDDVEVKVSALLYLLDDYPSGCFTKASLKRAAQRFKFFPSFAELSALLDAERSALEDKRFRLTKIADAQKQGPARAHDEPEFTGPRSLSPEIEAALARCKEELAATKPFSTVDRGRR